MKEQEGIEKEEKKEEEKVQKKKKEKKIPIRQSCDKWKDLEFNSLKKKEDNI